MGENAVIWTIGSLQVTAYGLCVGLSVLLGIVLTVLVCRRRQGAERGLSMCLWVLPLALIAGHLVYCLARISSLVVDYQHGAALLAMPWMGGYTVYGCLLGGLLGVYISDRGHFAASLDTAMPGAMLTLCLARCAEYFTGEGLGAWLDEEVSWFFPVGLCTYADEYYTEWRLPIFAWEAAVALVLCVLALRLLKKEKKSGAVAETVLALLFVTQIILESLRQDEFIRFGFVRFNQLASAVGLLVLLALHIWRRLSGRGWQIARSVMFVAGIGGVVAIEFGLDKSSIDNGLLYAAMVLMLVLLGTAVLREDGKGKQHE